MRKLLFYLLLWLTSAVSCLAQEAAMNDHHGLQGAHRLTVGLGHTHISEGRVDGKTKWLALASWTLNYDYWVTNKWAIGLQNDLVLESFKIEHGGQEILERSYPLAIVPVAIYKPGKHLAITAGVGTEIAHQKNLTLTRIGLEYGFHLPKNWEVGAALVWDNKWNYYNSWGLGLTFSKILKKK
ncbi:MAG: hypothetical protein EAZ58_00140 [Flavobacterium sp.]|jgi:hypothetical protein|nr:MAG: hypothetical protein EAZ58_00140 [Flavobacterium sp.]